MGKTQRSKRARAARRAAMWAGLRGNTGHPSHLAKRDIAAEARLMEKRQKLCAR